MSQAQARLPLGTLAIYGLPAASLGFMGALTSIYLLKFSTDVLLIAPGLMGLMFGLSRLWDAVSDPMAGYWSDRTRSALGRRRPWLLASAVPLALVFVALWNPPSSLEGPALAAWMGVGIVLYFTAQTAVSIPHLALGAELTLDYHERSRVFGARLILEFVGIFLAAAALALLERSADPRGAALLVSVVGGAVAAALIVWSGLKMRERREYQGRGAERPVAAFRDVLHNRHARLLLAVFFLDQLGFTMMITTMPYANEYVLEGKGLTGVYVGAAIGSALVFYPIWFPLARRFGKRDPWIAATAIKAVAFAGIVVLQPGQSLLLIVLIALIGGLQGAGGILGPSIKADVIDYDEYQTGQRKEGAYFATWNLATKTAAALSIAFTGAALQGAGFEPNVAQGASAQLAIRALMGGVPCLLYVVSALLLLRFGLNEREHSEIRSALDARQAAA